MARRQPPEARAFDVVIIGSGAAGLTAALNLASRFKVAVLAKGAIGAGNYPALAKDPNLASAQYMAAVVLNGRHDMPSFVVRHDLHGFEAMVRVGLEDAQIAEVVNYVRGHFGNHYADTLSAADVAALHAPKKESP